MEEAEDNMSSDDVRKTDSSSAVKKPKKRSLVERELETSLTARVTSPASVSDGLSTSRYGRARRLKTETELIESQKALLASIKSPGNEKTPVKVQSPTYRMHASNSPQKAETPKKPPASHLENQIDNIFQENASLSRFSEDTGTPSPAKKFPKVYIRKDLIQNREEDEPIMLISNLFSPTNSAAKSSGNNSVKSLEKYNVKQNGHVDNSSVVKTLDFDSNKKKKKDDKDKEQKPSLSKNELFEIEAKCPYQLGDLAWARMGTFPFWPCIVTRDPHSEMFVKKKLFGRVEHDIIHVTFFGDNGRRSWIVDNMLRKYLGLLEFETTREKFTPEDKKKDPRFYAAFFVSDKKQALWNTSVEEADSLLREPKRLRIDIFNDMLWKSRLAKKNPKSGKIMSRTDSDVSLSESLYDSLFSEQEVKTDDAERSKNRSRNKSFDVSEVVTACLDNMAAKTGITKIQRQSHMDRWLQKAKSKTPEKIQAKPVSLKIEKPDKKPVQDSKVQGKTSAPIKLNRNRSVSKTTKQSTGTPPIVKPYRFRRRTNSNPTQTETKESSKTEDKSSGNINSTGRKEDTNSNSLDVIANVHNNKQMIEDNIIIEKDPITQITENVIQENTNESNSVDVIQNKSHTDKVDERHEDLSMSICKDSSIVSQSINEINIKEANKTGYEVSNFIEEVKQTKLVNDKIEDTFQEKIDILSTNDKILHTEVVAQPENIPNIKTEYKEISAWSKEQTDNIEVISAENNLSDVLKVTCSGKTITCMESQDVTLNFPEQINPKQKVLDSIMIKEQNSSENNDSKAQNMDINNICQLDKHSKEMFIEDSSVMEVDDNVKTLNNQTEVANLSQLVRNAAMEVDEDANFEAQTNGNRCPKFETVSNKCVEDNDILMACTDTDLKDARNVTIEVSVTEKKNDDTLNNQLHEEQQGSIGNQKPQYQDIETNIFLDVCHSHKKNMVKTKDAILGHRNSSTPEKYEGHETLNSISSNTCIKKLNLDTTINVNASNNIQKELVEHVDDSNKSDIENKQKQNNETVDDITIIHEDSFDNKDNVLNESTQSDSILQCTYDDVAENDARLNDSNKSETILKLIESNPSVYKNVSLVDVTSKNEVNCVAEENHEIVTRQNVESPTFTQLLDSEEFFRDVNESKPSPPKLDTVQTLGNKVDSESVKQNTNLEQTSRNKAEKNMKSIGTDKVAEKIEDDSEEVSDDEPSPEYESLDEEITEDFRKHMMSIESNIKDKKDEEQIVKICNEIAEKAKLSPPKYILDGQMPTHNKLDTKSKIMPIINLNDKLEIDTSADKMHMKPDNKNSQDKIYSSFEKQKEPKTYTEKQSRILKNIKIDKHNISKRHDHIKIHTEETRVNIDGDSKLKVITDDNKPKIIYRTRRNMSNAIRDRASPGLKIEASKIEQYRRSAEYDPKVLLIRLERDASDCAKDTKSSKFLEDKSIDNKTITTLKQVSADLKHTEIKIKAIDNDKNIKSRLSLKRDSPRSKQPENKIMTEESKTLIRESLKKDELPTNEAPKELIFEQSKKEEIVISNLEVKKIHIENISKENKIPEGIKVNGYFHNIDRKFTETPDSGDTDFDIDAVSLNSEDSEISLPNSVESIPKRNLRSRPERTLENALRNPEFLKYLELKQDYLMDEHPELNEDEVIMYVYKTWQYEEDLKSDIKKIEDARHSNLIKSVKGHETPRSNKKKSQPKNNIENYFREKYEKSRKTIDFASESGCSAIITCETNILIEQKPQSDVPVQSNIDENMSKTDISVKRKTRSKSPQCIDLISENSNDAFQVNITKYPSNEAFKTNESTISIKVEENVTPKRSSRRSKTLTPKSLEKEMNTGVKSVPDDDMKKEIYIDTESIDSEDSEIPLRKLRSKVIKENTIAKELQKQITLEKKEDEVMKEDVTETKVSTPINQVKEELDETASTVSDNEHLFKQKKKRPEANSMEDPEFLKYLELKQDSLMDENPQLSQDEVVSYLFKTWLYEENSKSELVKNCESEQANLIKGLNNNGVAPAKKVKRKAKVDKHIEDSEVIPKEKPRRRIVQPFYNENYSDIEDELELFEIFKTKKSAITVVSKSDTHKDKIKSPPLKSMKEDHKDTPDIENKSQENNIEEIQSPTVQEDVNDVEYVDETEIYFTDLTKPKPNVFKGLAREKVCEICEYAGHLVKCKGCNGMFHPDCVKKESEAIEKEKQDILPLRGRKKKIKKLVRKTKSLEDSGSHSDERQDASADVSMEDLVVPEITFDAENFESQIELKMKEILDTAHVNYDSYSSDDGIDWRDSEAGKCEIIDVKWKRKDAPIDYSDFKCYNCQKYDVPICFVCKNAVSKTGVKMRQKCHVAHCHKYYHLECLDHWPQTQFNSGEPSRSNKKINEFFEAMTCPRHVCHTCVSDDPRGCKTRFSGDKLAKCVRCPATYHSFNKCLPAGSQVLTASHIICPRHCDQRPGKVPCHVNTGWCFICALGGSLICCEYCPTSFHAECLNIKPPEGNYMCEDCETGRLPLYGEMVWVKLGHYRWWPGIILHPSEIPDNIMAVKHEPGDFVVRFFGQYDHYWVNRGRVFPYQEGDSGRISSQKSKINEDFICAMEHAQRAYNILKNADPDEEESLDIESSLLPPHYVKLKCNKPCGSLCGRKMEDPSLSLTQCECNPDEPDPCEPYSQCLNRMLLTECGPTCRAGERCMNRAFEKRQYPKLVPYRTPHRGWGLKTLENIKAGQFVIEYVGELIDEEEFRRRMRRKHEIRDENFYFLTLDKERMIDAGPKGNVARFMNHCCEPNCETQKWTVLGDIRVGLFAIDDIPANSEVTFNYNLECAGIEKKRCLCGAKRCSGYIGAKPKQDESQLKKIKRPYNKKKKPEESPSTSKVKTKRLGRPPKPKELTELEKDVLIIKNATSSISSDESSRTLSEDKIPKPLKRKRVSNTVDEVSLSNGQESGVEERNPKALKKKRVSITTDEVSLSNGQESSLDDKNDKIPKALKRKRVSITNEEVSLSNGLEPSEKKPKCDEKPSEVGD